MIRIFTDGACLGNPGTGGWAAKILHPSNQTETLSGFARNTTNNRMELTAAIKALSHLLDAQKNNAEGHAEGHADGIAVELHSDSQYLVLGMNRWTAQWLRREWRTAAKKPVLNKDLWQKLLQLTNSLQPKPQFLWVKAHAGIAENEEVDKLAYAAAHNAEPENPSS